MVEAVNHLATAITSGHNKELTGKTAVITAFTESAIFKTLTSAQRLLVKRHMMEGNNYVLLSLYDLKEEEGVAEYDNHIRDIIAQNAV